MGDMGLQGAYGAAGAADALRQIIKDRLIQQQVQFENARQLAGDDRQNRQLDQNDQMRRDALAETVRQHNLTAANQTEDNNRALNEQIPAGTFFEDAPAQKPIVGRLQSVGGATMEPNQQERPKVDVGPLLPGDDGGEKKRGYLKLASSKQQTVQEAADAKVEAARQAAEDKAAAAQSAFENRTHEDAQKALDREALAKAAREGRQPAQHFTEPKDVWNPKTGQFEAATSTFNTSTGGYEPVKGTAPGGAHKAAPGEAQDAAWNAKRSDAVAKLGIVDQSIDAAKDLIGPGAGRVATFEQMLGNPDPRISDLKTKLLTVKDQVVGALTRSNRQPSPAMMKRFDELLGTQLTPESLHAATNALRQMLQPTEGASNGGSGGGKRIVYDINGNPVK